MLKYGLNMRLIQSVILELIPHLGYYIFVYLLLIKFYLYWIIFCLVALSALNTNI